MNQAGANIPGATASTLKRTLDVFGAVLLLVPAIPLVFIGIMVAFSYCRSPLFLQTRHGLQGRRFRIWKIRTMIRQRGRPRLKVSAAGRWIRATSIDELPQLLNVLRGEMSLVGPRPHPVPLNRKYRTRIPEFELRHSVRPGMTGLAQIGGARGAIRNEADMRHRVDLDVAYVRGWSLWLDLQILVLTPMKGMLPPVRALIARLEQERKYAARDKSPQVRANEGV